jgi:hypothetical protein
MLDVSVSCAQHLPMEFIVVQVPMLRIDARIEADLIVVDQTIILYPCQKATLPFVK